MSPLVSKSRDIVFIFRVVYEKKTLGCQKLRLTIKKTTNKIANRSGITIHNLNIPDDLEGDGFCDAEGEGCCDTEGEGEGWCDAEGEDCWGRWIVIRFGCDNVATLPTDDVPV